VFEVDAVEHEHVPVVQVAGLACDPQRVVFVGRRERNP
jgi:hypothetical protein